MPCGEGQLTSRAWLQVHPQASRRNVPQGTSRRPNMRPWTRLTLAGEVWGNDAEARGQGRKGCKQQGAGQRGGGPQQQRRGSWMAGHGHVDGAVAVGDDQPLLVGEGQARQCRCVVRPKCPLAG